MIRQCFDEITKVPRPSCHEEQIRAYLLEFAKKHSIAVKTDEVGNVVMSKKATAKQGKRTDSSASGSHGHGGRKE